MEKKSVQRAVVEQATAAPGEKRSLPPKDDELCGHLMGGAAPCVLPAGHAGQHVRA